MYIRTRPVTVDREGVEYERRQTRYDKSRVVQKPYSRCWTVWHDHNHDQDGTKGRSEGSTLSRIVLEVRMEEGKEPRVTKASLANHDLVATSWSNQ